MKIAILSALSVLAAVTPVAAAENPKSSWTPPKVSSRSSSTPTKRRGDGQNFLAYVDAGFYNGTIFHRVIPKFMIQGGGFTRTCSRKPLGRRSDRV